MEERILLFPIGQIIMFGNPKWKIRLINSGIKKNDDWILKIQIQKRIFGISYWKTISRFTNYKEAVYFYRCLISGRPVKFEKIYREIYQERGK